MRRRRRRLFWRMDGLRRMFVWFFFFSREGQNRWRKLVVVAVRGDIGRLDEDRFLYIMDRAKVREDFSLFASRSFLWLFFWFETYSGYHHQRRRKHLVDHGWRCSLRRRESVGLCGRCCTWSCFRGISRVSCFFTGRSYFPVRFDLTRCGLKRCRYSQTLSPSSSHSPLQI